MLDENNSELFEAIHSKGITVKNFERLESWSSENLFSLLDELREKTTEPNNISQGLFTFAANDSLSGRSVPFSDGETRIKKVVDLARFAALYADSLLIRDPFEWYPLSQIGILPDGTHKVFSRGLEPNDFSNQYIRRHFIDDIHFILFLEPLFSSGLAGFSKSMLHWCPNCVRIAAEKGILDTLVEEPEEIVWQKKVAKLVRHIEKTFIERGTTLIHQHGDHAHATIFMPDGLLEYDQVQTTLELPPRLAKRAIEPISVSTRDARKLRLFNDEIERIIDDISTQNATSNRFNYQYITDRTIDLELMNMVSDKRARTFNNAAMDALTHPLSFVDQVSLNKLLKLRKDDGESFFVYRDAVRSILKNNQNASGTELREAFDDVIRPELNKIDLTIKNSRKLLATSAITDITIAIASVSIAAFSGLLPASLGIPKDMLDFGAALGGWQSVRNLASKVAEVNAKPKEVSENKFAFLWKMKQEIKAKASKRKRA